MSGAAAFERRAAWPALPRRRRLPAAARDDDSSFGDPGAGRGVSGPVGRGRGLRRDSHGRERRRFSGRGSPGCPQPGDAAHSEWRTRAGGGSAGRCDRQRGADGGRGCRGRVDRQGAVVPAPSRTEITGCRWLVVLAGCAVGLAARAACRLVALLAGRFAAGRGRAVTEPPSAARALRLRDLGVLDASGWPERHPCLAG